MEEKILNKKINICDSKAKKFLTILGTSLLLLIPIGFLSIIIFDRTEYRDKAVQNVVKSWANAQTIGIPTMSFKSKNEKKRRLS